MSRGRKSPADQKRAINAAMDFYGIPQFKTAVLEYAPRKKSKERRERHILADILAALRKHPGVASVERRQSGVFRDADRFIRVGRRGDPDIGGMLKGGRAFAIEVKRPGHEPDALQQKRLDDIAAAGGLAGCAHSVEEALALLS